MELVKTIPRINQINESEVMHKLLGAEFAVSIHISACCTDATSNGLKGLQSICDSHKAILKNIVNEMAGTLVQNANTQIDEIKEFVTGAEIIENIKDLHNNMIDVLLADHTIILTMLDDERQLSKYDGDSLMADLLQQLHLLHSEMISDLQCYLAANK